MDPVAPTERIAVAVIVFAILMVVLGAAVYFGMMRERDRRAEAKKDRDEDRAFWREQFGIIVAAIRSESVLRLAAETERLHRRTVRPSE